MTIKTVSIPSSRFERCSISPGNLYLQLTPYATPKELEKCLSHYAPAKLKSELGNGETMLNELLRQALSKAAYCSNTCLIEYIVTKWGSYPLNMGDFFGEPPLGAALSSSLETAGHTSALMIQLGAKVNILITKPPFPPPGGSLLELVVCTAVDLKSYSQFLPRVQLLLQNGARIQHPTRLHQKELHYLILAQTKLAQKVEIAKHRTTEVRGALERVLPIVLITIINEMDEEPLDTKPVEPTPVSSQPRRSRASRDCIVM